MSNDYKVKTSGLTMLRYQASAARNRCNRMAKKGVIYKDTLVSFPLEKAEELIKITNNNKIRLDTLNKLVTRLSNHLEADKSQYNIPALKEISDTILVVLSEIEQ